MYLSEVKGKGGIVARCVARSSSAYCDKIITTMELEYPRLVHSEMMTHRVFSRNAASSRAIPVKKVIEQVRTNPATPVHWGANQAGMQADNELVGSRKAEVEEEWLAAANSAADHAEYMLERGAHKQVINRILEPYQFIKVVVTATEWNNFFALRDHKDADPTIRELAKCMCSAMDCVEPELLGGGEWHTPYVEHKRDEEGVLEYWTRGIQLDLNNALKVSGSCSAQVSYRLLDTSLEKAKNIYDKLVNSWPVHASPLEHCAEPMTDPDQEDVSDLTYGVTHVDKEGRGWSGNFCGWIQGRQTIDGNYVEG